MRFCTQCFVVKVCWYTRVGLEVVACVNNMGVEVKSESASLVNTQSRHVLNRQYSILQKPSFVQLII